MCGGWRVKLLNSGNEVKLWVEQPNRMNTKEQKEHFCTDGQIRVLSFKRELVKRGHLPTEPKDYEV